MENGDFIDFHFGKIWKDGIYHPEKPSNMVESSFSGIRLGKRDIMVIQWG